MSKSSERRKEKEAQAGVKKRSDQEFPYLAAAVAAIFVIGLIGLVVYIHQNLPSTNNSVAQSTPTAGGNGTTPGGVQCSTSEQLAYHHHSHLTLLQDGHPVVVPAQIGLSPCDYWVHVHDTSGIIHIEAPKPVTFTLGDFYDVWQVTFPGTTPSTTLKGTLTVYVNGKLYTGDPRLIPLDQHADIVIEAGTPVGPPPAYVWPQGV